MKTFGEFSAEKKQREEDIAEWIKQYDHETYKPVPGTKHSYRPAFGPTSAGTVKHSHVYAKPKGGGPEIYVVNTDRNGYDGASGMEIPTAHADYFRSLGYDIDSDNILQGLESTRMETDSYDLIILVE